MEVKWPGIQISCIWTTLIYFFSIFLKTNKKISIFFLIMTLLKELLINLHPSPFPKIRCCYLDVYKKIFKHQQKLNHTKTPHMNKTWKKTHLLSFNVLFLNLRQVVFFLGSLTSVCQESENSTATVTLWFIWTLSHWIACQLL